MIRRNGPLIPLNIWYSTVLAKDREIAYAFAEDRYVTGRTAKHAVMMLNSPYTVGLSHTKPERLNLMSTVLFPQSKLVEIVRFIDREGYALLVSSEFEQILQCHADVIKRRLGVKWRPKVFGPEE